MPDSISPLSPPESFTTHINSLHVALDPGDVNRLGRYLAMLLEANTRFNLTAITDPAEAWSRHILDSLTLLPVMASLEAKSIIDIGSGGGLPGIPLAVVLPETRFTLVEATGKKARFLQDVVAGLKLDNVKVVCDRAET